AAGPGSSSGPGSGGRIRRRASGTTTPGPPSAALDRCRSPVPDARSVSDGAGSRVPSPAEPSRSISSLSSRDIVLSTQRRRCKTTREVCEKSANRPARAHVSVAAIRMDSVGWPRRERRSRALTRGYVRARSWPALSRRRRDNGNEHMCPIVPDAFWVVKRLHSTAPAAARRSSSQLRREFEIRHVLVELHARRVDQHRRRAIAADADQHVEKLPRIELGRERRPRQPPPTREAAESDCCSPWNEC